jgi:hypothetical protein
LRNAFLPVLVLSLSGALSPVAAGAEVAPVFEETEVTFDSERDSVHLAGTLALPEGAGPHPAVLLVSPSGEHPRDEVRSGGKHYAALAAALAANGIASLRVDNRGVGASTVKGGQGWSWEWTHADLEQDVRRSLRFLRNHESVDPERIGLLGHGEGALTAMRVAGRSEAVAFLVLLSTSGRDGVETLLHQQMNQYRERGVPGEVLPKLEKAMRAALVALADDRKEAARSSLREMMSLLSVPEEQAGPAVEGVLGQFGSPWYRSYLRQDPAKMVRGMEPAVLVMNGADDSRIAASESLETLESVLAGDGVRESVTTVLRPGLGHFLEASSPDESAPVFASEVVDRIVSWIAERCRTR